MVSEREETCAATAGNNGFLVVVVVLLGKAPVHYYNAKCKYIVRCAAALLKRPLLSLHVLSLF